MWSGRLSGSSSALMTARHFIQNGWPLGHANVLGVLGAGALFLGAYGFKAWGWQRLFRHDQRPGTLALAAAGGAATVTGLALPGRADEVVRIIGRSQVSRQAGRHRLDLPLALPARPDRQRSPDAACGRRCGCRGADAAGCRPGSSSSPSPACSQARSSASCRGSSGIAGSSASSSFAGSPSTQPLRKEAAQAWGLVAVSWVLRVPPYSSCSTRFRSVRRFRSPSASSAPPRPPPRCRSLPRAASLRRARARGCSSPPGSTPRKRRLSPSPRKV